MIATKIKASKNQISPQIQKLDVSSLLKHSGRRFLLKLKQKSLRSNNTWFRVLSLDKRRFIDAVIQTVDRIQSSLLLKLVTELSEKLLSAIGGVPALLGSVSYGMITYGESIAQRVSNIAQVWGNKLAIKWSNDEGFIRYLTVLNVNNLPVFRVNSKL
jgi:hypothetical protein